MKLYSISENIAKSIGTLLNSFVSVDNVKLSYSIIFFFMTFILSIVGIISYDRFRKDTKSKYFFSKIKTLIIYFIFCLILSIVFLILYTTTENMNYGLNISMAILLGIFMIFSITNFKNSKEKNDLSFYKTEKNKLEKEIEKLKKEADDIA